MLRNLVVAAAIFLTCLNSNAPADSFGLEFFYDNARYNFGLSDDDIFFHQFDSISLSDNGDGIMLRNTNQHIEIRVFGTIIMDEPPPDTQNESRPQQYITPNLPLSVGSYRENISGHLLIAEAILVKNDEPQIQQIHIYATSQVSAKIDMANLVNAIASHLYILNSL